MPKAKELKKIVFCEHCNEKVYEGDTCYRLPLGQALAYRALYKHLSVCPKAPPIIKGCARKKTGEKAEKKGHQILNCPFCLKEQRVDHIRRHIHSKHKMQAVLAMSQWAREQAIKYRLPIASCNNSHGETALMVCLHCGKGHLETCRKKHTTRYDLLAASGEHKECIKEFESYQSLFEMKEFEPMPFYLDYVQDNPEEKPEEELNPIVGNTTMSKEVQEALIAAMNIDEEDLNDENIIEWVEDIDKVIQSKTNEIKKWKDGFKKLQEEAAQRIKELESQTVEGVEDRITTIERKYKQEIARLKKEMAEKDEYAATFETLRFGQGGRVSYSEDSD